MEANDGLKTHTEMEDLDFIYKNMYDKKQSYQTKILEQDTSTSQFS